MNSATILFKAGLTYRRDIFAMGLKTAGYVPQFTRPANIKRSDVLVIWNRHGADHTLAREFEAAKAKVLVVENGYLGKELNGEQMFAISHNHHNGAGRWPTGGPERWASLGIDLKPWREPGGECVILAQRGIGEPVLRAPVDWLQHAVSMTKGRIRRHPGTDTKGASLEDDLRNASSVVTWSSGAALKALTWGIPVFYGMPSWIGGLGGRRLEQFKNGALPEDHWRRAMFERLAWAMYSAGEIASGEAFTHLLRC